MRRALAKPFTPLVLLLLISVITLIVFDRPLIRGDGVAYLAWADTFVVDRDLDLSNQVERLRPVLTYQIQFNQQTGRWVIVFPFGVAVLQAPFYALGHLFASNGWLNINPAYFQQMQGVGLPYSLWLMIGANLLALAAIALVWLVGRRLCDRWTAALVVYVAFIGTPIFYYSTITPLNSHSGGVFAIAGYVYCLVRCTGAFSSDATPRWERWYGWVLMGVCAGLAVLSRWQLILAVAPGWLLLAWERRWRGFVIAGVVAALTVLPLPLVWQYLFGSPFLVPYDAVEGQKGAFLGASNHAWEVFVETVVHSPVVLLGLVGIITLWRRARRWALLTAGVILMQLLINGAALDWWAGESYGMRRMSELFAVYALLACAAVGRPLLPVYARFAWPTHRLLLIGLIGYTVVYILAFVVYSWTNPDHYLLARPEVMLRYFFDHPYRWQVLIEVMGSHVGPWAWAMPGP
jgi:4-amino-4-deoxy-L-arabinose transferase-like glycosyltransferase